MENILAKSTIGILLFSFIIGLCRFLLYRFLRNYDEKLLEIKELLNNEVKKAEHSFELLFDKYDVLSKGFNRLQGYIDGKEANK